MKVGDELQLKTKKENMAHDLTITNGKVEMFSGSGIRPWHGLGTIVEGLLTAKEAIGAAGLDWPVVKEPVYTKEGYKIEGYRAILRQDKRQGLGIVGTRYEPIQNQEAFSFFDEIIGEGQAIYDTAGSLDEGRRVWIMAKVKGELFLKNRPEDKTEKMVLLYNSHDGSGCLTMQIVATRVVCANTLSVALQEKSNEIKIRHTLNWKNRKDAAMKILGLVNGYYDDLQTVMDSLSEQKMDSQGMSAFVERLLPRKEDGELSYANQEAASRITTLFRHGKGNRGETRWDALNAVTEFVDHDKALRQSKTVSENEKRFTDSTFGGGAYLKKQAFALLTA